MMKDAESRRHSEAGFVPFNTTMNKILVIFFLSLLIVSGKKELFLFLKHFPIVLRNKILFLKIFYFNLIYILNKKMVSSKSVITISNFLKLTACRFVEHWKQIPY